MKNLKMKSARAALDLSQQQLADLVGVSRQTINAIEKGDYNPTIRLCIAICKALNRTNCSGRREWKQSDFRYMKKSLRCTRRWERRRR